MLPTGGVGGGGGGGETRNLPLSSQMHIQLSHRGLPIYINMYMGFYIT